MSEKSLLELGDLLKSYIKRSGKTQRQVAEEVGIPSPTYLSQMANARVNWVESDYFRPLTVALGLKLSEILELRPDLIVSDESPTFPAPLYERTDEVYMPQGLQDAVNKFGDEPEYADLRDPAIQRQLAMVRGFTGGPQTAGEWLSFYLANKRWLDKN